MTVPILETLNVTKHFRVKDGLFSQGSPVRVDSISLRIQRGETFAIVGESGCGKFASNTSSRPTFIPLDPS